MIYKVSRRLYNDCVGDPTKRRALAFAIFVKNKKPTSVVKGWSYRELSRISGLSVPTCQGRVAMLKQMHLVRIDGNSIVFKKLRRSKVKNKDGKTYHSLRRADIDIRKFTNGNIKDVERGLMAMLIVETQNRKDWIEQLIRLYHHSKDTDEYRRAQKWCRKRGLTEFADNGFSYKGIAQRLKCGFGTVTETIKFGNRAKMFKKVHSCLIEEEVGPGMGAKVYKSTGLFDFYSHAFVWRQPANRFRVIGV